MVGEGGHLSLSILYMDFSFKEFGDDEGQFLSHHDGACIPSLLDVVIDNFDG